MEKTDLHVVSFSGGKDSTAMLLRMIEENMPIDVILFCDTGIEFPELYAHIDQVEQDIGRKITRVRCEYDFEYLFCEKPVKRKKNTVFAQKYGLDHKGYGWAGPRMRWCTEKLKSQPREKFLRELKKEYNIIEYVGLAADEGYRMSRKCNQRGNTRHPLIDWGMTEADCLAYCKERGYDWGGLYELFHRVSCWCCPLQGIGELRKLYHHFPDLWQQLQHWDDITWRKFHPNYSVRELQKRFDFEDECLKEGKSIKDKAFYSALRESLKEVELK